MSDQTLRITEIFHSLQGEANTSGRATVFVRLTGCPLRCGYCDTEYAFHGGIVTEMDAILASIRAFGAEYVCVTGGEPLAQPNCKNLLTLLCDAGFNVSLETSGALSTEGVDPRVSVVLDLKTPGSGESHRNLYDNIPRLQKHDQVKFVICDREDYQWASFKCDELGLFEHVDDVWFSPVHGPKMAAQLADWMVEDGSQARFQMQLHKILWADEPGR
ncbi:7-carboxy-7-deazaguanine synthase [BD1-7 clade bacterium]|uniref:7-carboxy-7-deazaguanine synthase n=1 Tax=BD1-7 clade bacterium TaxID=2029982 RepID=A0A5S9MYJ1_9GAMM|nr:7-carboxy-7-deazaguanine synthase [BD1-7 clade bacterium]